MREHVSHGNVNYGLRWRKPTFSCWRRERGKESTASANGDFEHSIV